MSMLPGIQPGKNPEEGLKIAWLKLKIVKQLIIKKTTAAELQEIILKAEELLDADTELTELLEAAKTRLLFINSTKPVFKFSELSLPLPSVGLQFALGATAAAGISWAAGLKLADDAVEDSKIKIAVPIYVNDPDMKSKPIGYIYGGKTGVPSGVAGTDKSIPINPEDLEERGTLYYWYQALTALEDKGHEGGFSDITGINYRMPYTILRAQGGGSSVADQACGAMRDQLPQYIYFDESPDTTPEKLEYYPGKVRKKIEETLCGVGVATLLTPKEIAAKYGTYAYMAPWAFGIEVFIQKYWGLEGVNDPDLTVGKQLLLASFLKRPWRSEVSDENGDLKRESNWDDTVGRAKKALGILIEKGIIEEKDKGKIEKEINDSKPKHKDLVRKNKEIYPKKGYATAIDKAISETKKVFGDTWRTEVSAITLTIDPNVQGVAFAKSQETLNNINDDRVRSVVLVVDSGGKIIAVHSSGISGEDDFDVQRLFSERSPGSMGKILLAAGVANEGEVPPKENPYSSSFYENLSRSKEGIIEDAKSLGVSDSESLELISCYGEPNTGKDQTRKASLGMFETNPIRYSATLYEAYSGNVMPAPYIVSSYKTNDGEIITIYPDKREDHEDCAKLMYADGRTKEWLKAPLDSKGTLRDLYGVADMGKTGTVGSQNSDANVMAWTIAANAYADGSFYTVIVGFGNEIFEPVPALHTGGNVAGPVAKDILLKIDGRKGQDALAHNK